MKIFNLPVGKGKTTNLFEEAAKLAQVSETRILFISPNRLRTYNDIQGFLQNKGVPYCEETAMTLRFPNKSFIRFVDKPSQLSSILSIKDYHTLIDDFDLIQFKLGKIEAISVTSEKEGV